MTRTLNSGRAPLIMILGVYVRLDQLAGVKKSELAKLHGMGPSAIKALTNALHQRGLSLGS